MTAISETIIQGGASIPLYPFLVEVFNYFKIILFQLTPNSIRTMVAFYIGFMEANIGKLSAVEFAYIYCIKALSKNERFWYTSKRGPNVEGV